MSIETWGTDPELFAVDPDQSFEGAFPVLEGTPFVIPPAVLERFGLIGVGPDKHPVYFENQIGRIIGDGAAFEINLKRPYTDPMEMFSDTQRMVEFTREQLARFKVDLWTAPAANFNFRRYRVPDQDLEPRLYWSTIAGCDPDKDALEGNTQCPTVDLSMHPYRYAGGHVHVAGEDIGKFPLQMIRLLAISAGNFANANSSFYDQVRANTYGKAGKYRVQKYPNGATGVEYRTPSNNWLSFTREKAEQFFSMFRWAESMLSLAGEFFVENFHLLEETKAAIKAADRGKSVSILSSLGLL